MVEAEDNEAVARLSLDIGVRAGLHIETLPVTSIGIPGENSRIGPSSEVACAGGEPEAPDQWQVPRRGFRKIGYLSESFN